MNLWESFFCLVWGAPGITWQFADRMRFLCRLGFNLEWQQGMHSIQTIHFYMNRSFTTHNVFVIPLSVVTFQKLLIILKRWAKYIYISKIDGYQRYFSLRLFNLSACEIFLKNCELFLYVKMEIWIFGKTTKINSFKTVSQFTLLSKKLKMTHGTTKILNFVIGHCNVKFVENFV